MSRDTPSPIDENAALRTLADELREGKALSDLNLDFRFPHLMPRIAELARELRVLVDAEAALGDESEQPSSGHIKNEIEIEALNRSLVKYNVSSVVNRSPNGTVFKGRQISPQRAVAIKVISDAALESESRTRRFEREIDLVSRLQLPNIVQIYESGTIDGKHYYVMQYVQGLGVDDYMLVHDASLRERVTLFVKIVRAVERAHQRGIIHRDLKPSNIMVDEGGEPQILDFGIAKALDHARETELDHTVTHESNCIGTLPYMCPEQVSGIDDVDTRSDVYTLGVVMFRLLTGQYPYDVSGERRDVLRTILQATPRVLGRTGRPTAWLGYPTDDEFDADLQTIASKTLRKDKDERYQSASELADDLQRYLDGDIVQARADQKWYLTRRLAKQYRVHLAAIVVMISTLVWANLKTAQERNDAREFANVAHGALDRIVTKIDGELDSLAGGRALRKQLLDGIAEELSVLGTLGDKDGALSMMSVQLAEKEGDIARAEGRTEQAVGFYMKAIDRLSVDENPVMVASIYRKAGRADPTNAAHLKQALAIIRATNHQGADTELARVLVETGRADYLKGAPLRARMHLEEALQLLDERVTDPELRACALEWMGDVLFDHHELAEASGAFEEALEIRQRLAESAPADVRNKHARMLAAMKMSTALSTQGNHVDAFAFAQEAVREIAYLHNVDRDNPDFARDFMFAHTRLASIHRLAGRPDEALHAVSAGIDVGTLVVTQQPNAHELSRQLGFALHERARIHLKIGNTEGANQDTRDAVAFRLRLSEMEPENFDYQSELARSLELQAWCLKDNGRIDQALVQLERARQTYLSLAREQPSTPGRLKDVITTEINLAAWHTRKVNPINNLRAHELLLSAKGRIDELCANTTPGAPPPFVSGYLRMIEDNQIIIEERSTEFIHLEAGPPQVQSLQARPRLRAPEPSHPPM